MEYKKIIIRHLLQHKTITSMEAFENYAITRLSDVIFRLRNEGHIIDSEPRANATGKKHFVAYRLKKLKPMEQLTLSSL